MPHVFFTVQGSDGKASPTLHTPNGDVEFMVPLYRNASLPHLS